MSPLDPETAAVFRALPESLPGPLRRCVEGTSVGDAFGETFFVGEAAARTRIARRELAKSPWRCTDDSVMTLAVAAALAECDEIDADWLATLLAALYAADPSRGYGGTAHGILAAVGRGEPWAEVSARAFDGMGSMGNGAAMRAAPVGVHFAGDLDSTIVNARRSARVTHAHHEAQAGAIAVAVAASLVAEAAAKGDAPRGDVVLAHVIELTPRSTTRDGLLRARSVPFDLSGRSAGSVLGNGSALCAHDTVPFAIWAALGHLDNYPEALWTTVDALGDRDTTCAIVGGIVASGTPAIGIPPEWIAAREPLSSIVGRS